MKRKLNVKGFLLVWALWSLGVIIGRLGFYGDATTLNQGVIIFMGIETPMPVCGFELRGDPGWFCD